MKWLSKKKKDINPIIESIQKEVRNLNAALYVIEISQNSIKRERYCKKFKLNLNQFLALYNQARNEIMMYPVQLNAMKAVINLRGKTKKEYNTLQDNVYEILNKMIDKVVEAEKESKLNEMEKFLNGLEKEG